jgi:hypothetical protein
LDLHRIFWWPNNSGAARYIGKGGKERMVKFGKLGSPDLFAIVAGHIFGIELKGLNGFQSQAQVYFQHAFEKAGADRAHYVLARSLEDVLLALEAKVIMGLISDGVYETLGQPRRCKEICTCGKQCARAINHVGPHRCEIDHKTLRLRNPDDPE